MTRLLVVGATSAIAAATARRFAAEGARLVLAGRNAARLRMVAEDLQARGAAEVAVLSYEATEPEVAPRLLSEAEERLGGLDAVLIAHGTLPEAEACRRDPARAAEALVVNGVSAVLLAEAAAARLPPGGCVAVLGSVAGDRGRRSNYLYGAAKAMVDVYLEGLRHRLTGSRIRVVTVKPGLVDTPMTAHISKGPLFATPDRVGAAVHRAMHKRDGAVYVPWWWRPVLFLIRVLPERLFRRLPL